MKSNFFLKMSACALTAAVTLAGCADDANSHRSGARDSRSGSIPTRDDRNSREVAGGPVGGANGPEYRVPTGSNLPQSYNRRGNTTDSRDPEYELDQNDIRVQSTNSVGDALRSVPGVSVPGPR